MPRHFAVLLGFLLAALPAGAEPDRPRKVVLLAGPLDKGHPAGTHEYEKSVRLLKHCLDTSPNLRGLRTEMHLDGWPDDPRTLDDADAIVLVASGSDRREADHPLLVSDRLAVIERQMKRGCGLALIHWATFVPKARAGDKILDWVGGYFDYESGPPPRGWYSKIQTATTTARPGTSGHSVCRGLAPFQLREEYYYQLRFRERDPRLVPLLVTPIPKEAGEHVVAWGIERPDGGRGFGFTGGHFFDNWEVENFRKLVLNAVAWIARAEVPEGGVRSTTPTAAELASVPVGRPARVLILTGHQYPGHPWRETTQALQEALAPDRRLQVTVAEDPEFLARPELAGFDVIVFNYCNWEKPGLSEAAKKKFVQYLSGGGGLVLVHFANGAFHFSLPKAGESDWPEWRTRICRRVWDHTPGKSGHDRYGKFLVDLGPVKHPITEGMTPFETTDELYFRQQGEEPIVVLATARSTVTKQAEPMAFVYDYGKGRVFQTVLGHDAPSLRTPGTAELVRRGTAWAARRTSLRTAAATPAPPTGALTEGKFGRALNARRTHATATEQAAYRTPPLSVDCWARVLSKSRFNILVACDPKESADHWELYTYAGGGDLSAYLPGYTPAEIRSGVDIADGAWHHVAMAFDGKRVRLFVDGKSVKDVEVRRARTGGPHGPLWIGAYPPQQIGCDGVVDEVRVSSGARDFTGLPTAPPLVEDATLGLWRLDALDGGRFADLSKLKNPAVLDATASLPAPNRPTSETELDYRPSDPRLKAMLLDRSPSESYVAIKADTTGRLFVGGREALFVFEPDGQGGYRPKQELYRFPPDSWIAGIEIRGDDLYVLTAPALYVFPGGRLARTGLKPKRLVWGVPLDLHVSYHCLAWGPEGDLYLNHGDPLLNYGDFARPDHWGHWSIHHHPEGKTTPYTGQGAVLRVRPDGSGVRFVAGGLRGPFGLAFDRHWQLFTNDNDHESMPDRYTPARLLHAAPGTDFAWPRGWVASRTPERADLVEPLLATPGRGVPIGLAYYDDPHLPAEYRHALLQDRWESLAVYRYPLAPRGASYAAAELPLLQGRHHARPVGVAVGRGGRVFVTICYMAGNEASPHYISDLVMVTRTDDPARSPFAAYDAPTATPERLWAELSDPSWSRRLEAHTELLRRGGALLTEAIDRLRRAADDDPALGHLPWLAGAAGTPAAAEALLTRARHARPEVRQQAVRALAEYPALKAPDTVFTTALSDADAHVRLAALTAFQDPRRTLPVEAVVRLAASDDTYFRQLATGILARRLPAAELARLAASPEPTVRRAAVLAAGRRLTVPPSDDVPPAAVKLSYPSENAFFKVKVPYADGVVDLRTLGRIGSYTIAERWKTIGPEGDGAALFDLLVKAADDGAESVRLPAAYFLGLLRDSRSEPIVARVNEARTESRLAGAAVRPVGRAWVVGPLADGEQGLNRVHPPEQGAVDLTSRPGGRDWREQGAAEGVYEFPGGPEGQSYYAYFRLQAPSRQPVQMLLGSTNAVKVWHNGRLVWDYRLARKPTAQQDRVLLDAQPGSNDLLIRVHTPVGPVRLFLHYRAATAVSVALPEALDSGLLRRRLEEAAVAGKADGVPREFLALDWSAEAKRGDREVGRKLFGTLACAKCHAITADGKGGGAPSLAEAGKRFTVPHLVESVLLPGKQVADAFRATHLVTLQGLTLTGLVVQETAEALDLLVADGSTKRVAKKDVEERTLTAASAMPAGLVKTPGELRDLLAYLLSDNPLPP